MLIIQRQLKITNTVSLQDLRWGLDTLKEMIKFHNILYSVTDVCIEKMVVKMKNSFLFYFIKNTNYLDGLVHLVGL